MFSVSCRLGRRSQTVRQSVRQFIQDSASKQPAAAESIQTEVTLSRKQRVIDYLTMVKNDYREALREVTDYGKKKPLKAALLSSLLGFGLYANRTNPDEKSYRENFLLNCHDLSQIGDPVRSDGAEKLHNYVARAYNAGLLRRLDLVVCSLIWVDNQDPAMGVFSAQCQYTQPTWADLRYRIVDVGFLGDWWISSKKMVEYDVDTREWNEDGSPANNANQLS